MATIEVPRSFVANLPTVPPGVPKTEHTVLPRTFFPRLPMKHHCLLHGHLWVKTTLTSQPGGTIQNPKRAICMRCQRKLLDNLRICRIFACRWEVCEDCEFYMELERHTAAMMTWPRYDSGKSRYVVVPRERPA